MLNVTEQGGAEQYMAATDYVSSCIVLSFGLSVDTSCLQLHGSFQQAVNQLGLLLCRQDPAGEGQAGSVARGHGVPGHQLQLLH